MHVSQCILSIKSELSVYDGKRHAFSKAWNERRLSGSRLPPIDDKKLDGTTQSSNIGIILKNLHTVRHARTFSPDLAEYSPGLKLISQSVPDFAERFQIGLRFLLLL